MAAPAPAATQQPQQETDQGTQLAAQAAIVLGSALIAEQAVNALAALFAAAGISRLALRGAVTVVMSLPPERMGASGPATRNAIYLNLIRRAQFLVAASRRMQRSIEGARSRGDRLADVIQLDVARERRLYGQHMLAVWNRAAAAAKVDGAAAMYGPLLGWNTVLDSRTSAECKAANGRNFYAGQMPLIGYPGAVHPHCRCYPGRPHAGARLLPSAQPRRNARIAA